MLCVTLHITIHNIIKKSHPTNKEINNCTESSEVLYNLVFAPRVVRYSTTHYGVDHVTLCVMLHITLHNIFKKKATQLINIKN